MSDFIYEGVSLATKTDIFARPASIPASSWWGAADKSELNAALNSSRAAILAGKLHGFAPQGSRPVVAGADRYLWVDNTNALRYWDGVSDFPLTASFGHALYNGASLVAQRARLKVDGVIITIVDDGTNSVLSGPGLAKLAGGNSFTGIQGITGDVNVTGDLDVSGDVSCTTLGATDIFGATVTQTSHSGGGTPMGIVAQTPDAASAGSQQKSPLIGWTGQGWKTNATAGSQPVDVAAQLRPIQGAAAPTGKLFWMGRINGGSWTDLADLDTSGNMHVVGGLTVDGTTTISGYVPTSRTVSTSTGLNGGGDLSANRTFSLADTAVAPATYNTPYGLIVDQQGRITGATQGIIAQATTSVTITPAAATTGTNQGFKFTAGADTGQTAATLNPSVKWDLTATRTFSPAGSWPNQYEFHVVGGPTYKTVSATTIPIAASVGFIGAPSPFDGNTVLTKSTTLYLQNTTSTKYELIVDFNAAAAAHTLIGFARQGTEKATIGYDSSDRLLIKGAASGVRIDSQTGTNGTNGSFCTIDDGVGAKLGTGSMTVTVTSANVNTNLASAAATVSFNASLGGTYSFQAPAGANKNLVAFQPGSHTAMTASTEVIDYDFGTSTARTLTWVNGALATQRFALFRKSTIAFTSGTQHVTDSATVTIEGAPVAGASATFDNAVSSLWVQAGQVRFDSDGTLTNGSLLLNNPTAASTGTRDQNPSGIFFIGSQKNNASVIGTSASIQLVQNASISDGAGKQDLLFKVQTVEALRLRNISGTGVQIGFFGTTPVSRVATSYNMQGIAGSYDVVSATPTVAQLAAVVAQLVKDGGHTSGLGLWQATA